MIGGDRPLSIHQKPLINTAWSGTVISELMPHQATVADELTVVRSMKAAPNVHDSGANMMN